MIFCFSKKTADQCGCRWSSFSGSGKDGLAL